MYLSHNNIFDALKNIEYSSFIPNSNGIRIQGCAFLLPMQTELNPAILYLSPTGELPAPEAVNITDSIIISFYNEDECRVFSETYGANIICITDKMETAAVINQLLIYTLKVLKWAERLESYITSGRDFNTIVELGAEVFGNNPLLIINPSYNVLGCSTSCSSNEIIQQVINDGYMSKGMTDALSRRGYHRNATRFEHSGYVDSDTYVGCPFALTVFHKNETFLGFIVLYFTEWTPSEGELELFRYFSQVLYNKHPNLSADLIKAQSPIEVFIEDLLEHTKENHQFFEDRAKFLHIPIDAQYRVCVIKWDKYVKAQAEYLLWRIKKDVKLPTYKIMFYHESILILIKGDITSLKLKHDIYDSLETLKKLLEIADAYAGFSLPCFPLVKLNIAHQQALSAIKYGKQLKSSDRMFFFSAYSVFEMLDDYSHRYNLEDIYVRNLELLRGDDNTSDNFHLLRNYLLTERNISVTAKLLHMHRNSVIYRLNKIQEILSMNLNDPDVRLRLMISYKIIELKNKQLEDNSLLITSRDDDPVSFE